MFWYCSTVKPFWEYINKIVGIIIGKALPSCPALYLIGCNPNLLLSFQKKRMILAVSTAAKKTIIKNWSEPTAVMKRTWQTVFSDVCLLERSTARINKARADTVHKWSKATEIISWLY